MDFALIMVIALLVTGAIWGMDAVWWAPRRRRGPGALLAEGVVGSDTLSGNGHDREPLLVEYARSFFPVILIVLLLRSFIVEPFRIPSASMMPTLLAGDFILVNKFTYGLRLPVIDKKIVEVGKPERGDVVVFRYPRDPSIDYIKRVIGLPGDRITYHDKKLTINGEPVSIEALGRFMGDGAARPMTGADLLVQQLGEKESQILVAQGRPAINGEFEVPEGHYFVMGDNRDNSNDSRFWGTVPEENLVGRAFMIWMNWDSVAGNVTWSRIGSDI